MPFLRSITSLPLAIQEVVDKGKSMLLLLITLMPIPPLLVAMVYAALALVDQFKREESAPFLAPAFVPSRETADQGSYVPAGLLHVYRLAEMERGSPAPQKECVWR
jgi:hypothetical protein